MNDGLSEDIRKKIIDLLNVLFPEAKIYLFGSRAIGSFQKNSDIDIAIDAGKKLPIEVIDEANAVMQSLNIVYKVDILDLYNISQDRREDILKNKVIWKK